MTPDPNLVEQIVAAVERRLQTEAPESAGPVVADENKNENENENEDENENENEIICHESIVTGELLGEQITCETRQLRIAVGSILTPTAREIVARHELTVTVDAIVPAPGDVQQAPAGWRLLLADPDVPELTGYVSERSGGTDEAVSRSCEWLSGDTSPGVVVLSTDPHRLVCLANRCPEVRAAVVGDVEEASRVLGRLGANLVVACPLAAGSWRSRQIVETCLAAAPPVPPADWPTGTS